MKKPVFKPEDFVVWAGPGKRRKDEAAGTVVCRNGRFAEYCVRWASGRTSWVRAEWLARLFPPRR